MGENGTTFRVPEMAVSRALICLKHIIKCKTDPCGNGEVQDFFTCHFVTSRSELSSFKGCLNVSVSFMQRDGGDLHKDPNLIVV